MSPRRRRGTGRHTRRRAGRPGLPSIVRSTIGRDRCVLAELLEHREDRRRRHDTRTHAIDANADGDALGGELPSQGDDGTLRGSMGGLRQGPGTLDPGARADVHDRAADGGQVRPGDLAGMPDQVQLVLDGEPVVLVAHLRRTARTSACWRCCRGRRCGRGVRTAPPTQRSMSSRLPRSIGALDSIAPPSASTRRTVSARSVGIEVAADHRGALACEQPGGHPAHSAPDACQQDDLSFQTTTSHGSFSVHLVRCSEPMQPQHAGDRRPERGMVQFVHTSVHGLHHGSAVSRTPAPDGAG